MSGTAPPWYLLCEAINEGGTKGRDKARLLAHEKFVEWCREHSVDPDHAAGRIYIHSPILSSDGSGATVKARITARGIFDVVATDAAIQAIAHGRPGMKALVAALIDPHQYGVPGRSTCGFQVGVAQTLATGSTLRALVATKSVNDAPLTVAHTGINALPDGPMGFITAVSNALANYTTTTPEQNMADSNLRTFDDFSGTPSPEGQLAKLFNDHALIDVAQSWPVVTAGLATNKTAHVDPALVSDTIIKALLADGIDSGNGLGEHEVVAIKGLVSAHNVQINDIVTKVRANGFGEWMKQGLDEVSDKSVDVAHAILCRTEVALNLFADGVTDADDDEMVPTTGENEVSKRIQETIALGKKIASTPVEPSIAMAMNALLGNASEGGFTGLMERVNKMVADVEEIQKMTGSMSSAPSTQLVFGEANKVSAPEGSTVGDPTMKTMKAWELFAPSKVAEEMRSGKRAIRPDLNFDVPVFDGWQNGAHPDVPKIDPDYQFNTAILRPVLWGLLHNTPIWLHGHTGAGKSTLVKQICARLGWPCIRVNLDSEITRLDFVGRETLTEQNGVTVSKFEPGVLPRAMEQACVFLADECDFGRSDIMYVMQSVLEADGFRLTEDGGRWISPHPMFRIVATGNTKGQGDEYGCYSGARVQSAALLDRFGVWVSVPYLPAKNEAALVRSKVPGLSASRAEQLVRVANEMRKAFVNGEILTPASPRGLVTAGAMFMSMLSTGQPDDKDTLKAAVAATMIGKASDADRAKADEFVAAHII